MPPFAAGEALIVDGTADVVVAAADDDDDNDDDDDEEEGVVPAA